MHPGYTHTLSRMQKSLSQPSAVIPADPPSGGTLSLSLPTYAAHTCFHSPSSPTLALICHTAWKGWFSPSVGPWCQSSLAHFFHPQTSFCCVYPVLFLVLSVTPTSLSHPTPSKCFLSQTHHCDVCKTHGNHFSDTNNFIISLHSCLSYTFLALYLDGNCFDTMFEFLSVCAIPSIYIEACHSLSSLAFGLDELEYPFQPKWFYNFYDFYLCVFLQKYGLWLIRRTAGIESASQEENLRNG